MFILSFFIDKSKNRIDFLTKKQFADEGIANLSNYDIMDNNLNFSNNVFDFSDRNDFMENGFSTNQTSNFFSKFLRYEDEKI